MKKVGIMTWWDYHNFGTALQVTALSKTIKNMGYEPQVINYKPHGKVLSLEGKQKIVRGVKIAHKRLKDKNIHEEARAIRFKDFIKENISLTAPAQIQAQLEAFNKTFDAFVCGSDQVWSPVAFNPKYFLDFVKDPHKMIAYGPSMGVSHLKDPYIMARMAPLINRFKHLSIREKEGQQIIKALCHKEAKVVLDPTFLLEKEEWDQVATQEVINEDYILCYFLGNNEQALENAKLLSKKTGWPIKLIPIYKKDFNRGLEVVSAVGPGEFLNLIRNAKMVYSDSFHGIVFSIIYEKPFFVYERFVNTSSVSQNSRIHNLLKLTGLEKQLIHHGQKLEESLNKELLNYDYAPVRARLSKVKEESKTFLKGALEESTAKEKMKMHLTSQCCGCGSCSAVCHANAIKIGRNEQGFLNVTVNEETCTGCKLCEKVCPYIEIEGQEINAKTHKLFMTYAKEKEVLNKSSSGGIGHVVGQWLCENDHDVVGCMYDEKTQSAMHKLVEKGDIRQLHIFQGSKYIQSHCGDAIKEMKETSQKAVVFGLPCQIAGIDKLLRLKKVRENFVLVDLICHGVPTQNLWHKYLKEGAQKYGYGEVPQVTFRDKTKGWKEKYLRIEGNSKQYLKREDKDLFYKMFLLDQCLMDTCYECGYKTRSSADLRIGDYWHSRYIKDKQGISMAIALSTKAEEVLNDLSKQDLIHLEERECQEYWQTQSPQSSVKPIFYPELMADLIDENTTLTEIYNKYGKEYDTYYKLLRTYNKIQGYVKR